MQFKTTMKLNDRQTVEMVVDAPTFEEAVAKSSVFLDFTGACGLCNEKDVSLKSKKSPDGAFTFTKYECNVCGATQPFGKRKTDGGLFLKPWEKKFEGTSHE